MHVDVAGASTIGALPAALACPRLTHACVLCRSAHGLAHDLSYSSAAVLACAGSTSLVRHAVVVTYIEDTLATSWASRKMSMPSVVMAVVGRHGDDSEQSLIASSRSCTRRSAVAARGAGHALLRCRSCARRQLARPQPHPLRAHRHARRGRPLNLDSVNLLAPDINKWPQNGNGNGNGHPPYNMNMNGLFPQDYLSRV